MIIASYNLDVCLFSSLSTASDPCQEIPLSQLSPSIVTSGGTSTSTIKTLNCPSAQEHQNQMSDSVRRLASKVTWNAYQLLQQYAKKTIIRIWEICTFCRAFFWWQFKILWNPTYVVRAMWHGISPPPPSFNKNSNLLYSCTQASIRPCITLY